MTPALATLAHPMHRLSHTGTSGPGSVLVVVVGLSALRVYPGTSHPHNFNKPEPLPLFFLSRPRFLSPSGVGQPDLPHSEEEGSHLLQKLPVNEPNPQGSKRGCEEEPRLAGHP